MDHAMPLHPYVRLVLMALLSFVCMYGLMYMMVDQIGNVLANPNQLYMAGMMTVPMIILELMVMHAMYPNKRANAGIMGVSVAFGILFLVGIRTQALVADRQFLKSMIPHHAAAILMCEKARLHEPDIQKLCESIVTSQQAEIDWMQAKLHEP